MMFNTMLSALYRHLILGFDPIDPDTLSRLGL
jgi:hypothetical protein